MKIGGGYLIWIWLREHRSFGFALLGAAILILYGVVPTFQPANFGRVYAAYGGIFVVLSIFWGWKIDKINPDRCMTSSAASSALSVCSSSCTGLARSHKILIQLPRLQIF